jgi:serine/threonine protein kinase
MSSNAILTLDSNIQQLLSDNGYIVTKALGSGQFGHTYLAQKDMKLYTIKVPIGDKGRRVLAAEYTVLHSIVDECKYHFICLADRIPKSSWRSPIAIVSKYVPGESLVSKRIGYSTFDGIPLTDDQLIRIIIDMLIALTALSKMGMAHCDIKPANIIYSQEDGATLIDFGLATMDSRTGLAGSPNFILPKLYSAGSVLKNANTMQDLLRSDLYALGVTLYQLTNIRLSPYDPIPGRISLDYNNFYESSYNNPVVNDYINRMLIDPFLTAEQLLTEISPESVPIVSDRFIPVVEPAV